MAIRVLLADDHSLVRAGYRTILGGESDLDVVGEAPDGKLAVELATSHAPDVVLMDIRMPHLDGIEATRRITTSPGMGSTRVIVLTTFDLDEYVFAALRAGASAFLLKGVEPLDLIRAVRTVADGEALLDPGATRRLIEAYVVASTEQPSAVPMALPGELTTRETEILRLVAAGFTNAEIAERLVLSPLTAKSHLSRILTKLGARDRTQLVIMAYESGLVVPGRSEGLRPQD
jgi:DNA-binding NarL/FixJ family response regulator